MGRRTNSVTKTPGVRTAKEIPTYDRGTRRALDVITSAYLRSRRFNGIPLTTLSGRLRKPLDETTGLVADLVGRELLSVNVGDVHPNPHIKAFKPQPVERQLENLRRGEPFHTCIYPEPRHLLAVVDKTKYAGRPFTLRLALGEPQLVHAAFELSILEFYRNDPRYHYRHDDTQGSISISSAYYRKGRMPARDQILLETFGFAYNGRFDRAVASFLWYLSTLTPEHQSIWQAKILRGNYKLHPVYFRTNIMGEWVDQVSIFTAFLEELRVINAMSKAMGRKPLFRNEIDPHDKPREFGFLIRPTSKEFDEFQHMLDKLISDNISPAFFGGEIDFDEEFPRSDGRIEIRRKGTLRALQEWISLRFRPRDAAPIDEMFDTFKAIRKARQRPAHAVDDNRFEQKYFRQQRQLVNRAYNAIRTLRLILANHPSCRQVSVPKWLFDGQIYDY